jgi:quinoprotein glucose dehydrogenase
VLWAASVAASAGQADGLALEAGVYSVDQAKRGKAHYDAFCATCHVGDLSGTLAADTGAPPLRGAPFVTSMERKGVAAVFDYIKATMPADDPSSLDDAEYRDILAYLIQANGFPAGTRELTAGDLPRIRVRRAAP